MQTFLMESHGARIEVRSGGDVASALRHVLAPGTAIRALADRRPASAETADARLELQPPSATAAGCVWHDDEMVASGDDLGALEAALAAEVQLATAVHARDAVFVHAGVVALRGVGIVMPGRSMTGKSTLVRALVEHGAQYYSDEFAVLDATGRVHPHATPISIRVRGRPRLMVPAGRVGTAPIPVGLVVSTRFEPSARWAPRTSDGVAGAMPLVDNTVAARLAPERMLEAVAAVAEGALCLTGPRPEADTIVGALIDTVDGLVETRTA